MTTYLVEGASLSSPSVSNRTVNLFHHNKTVNQRTDLIKCAVWVYLDVNAVLPWPSLLHHAVTAADRLNMNTDWWWQAEKNRKILTIFPEAGTLIFIFSSCFSPPPPPDCWYSTCSQRQSDGVVTVTMSPFRQKTLSKVTQLNSR